MGYSQRIRAILRIAVAPALLLGAGHIQAPAQIGTARQTTLIEPPPPLLPATLGKLTRRSDGDSGDGLGRMDAAGLTAQDKAVLTEDGLKRFAKSDYGNSNGKDFWIFDTVTVFQFRDLSGAISAFDYLHRDGMRPARFGDVAARMGDDLLFRSGPDVVQEHFAQRQVEAGVTDELIAHLPKATGAAGVPPILPTLLPTRGLDTGSVKYAVGPVGYAAMKGVLPADLVGFDKSAETVTATYFNGGALTLVLYPTPQIAGDHLRAGLAQNASATIRQEGPLVAIATGAWPPGAARKIVDGVHLKVEASYDQPMPLDFHVEITKTYTLLESVAIFCGLGALAAIVLGLFFGGGRALVRVMQGKPAAVEPEFLHIDLSGRPHRIRTGSQSGPEA